MLHRQNEIIAERYQVITTLGEGDEKSSYIACDLYNSQPVVLKVFLLHKAVILSSRLSKYLDIDWKIFKSIFEREAEILLNLDLPSIPNYIDYFEIDVNEERRFYLIREFIAGESLAELVANSWYPNETELKDLIIQLLNTLSDLHSLSPYIVHQNIKPENIIFSENNRIYLVDFGAIQDIFRHFGMNGLILNSFEENLPFIYRSPEKIKMIRIDLFLDLYSVGYCLLFLLTRKSPLELLRTSTELDLATLDVTPDFQRWLKNMVARRREKPFESSTEAIEAIPSNLLTPDKTIENVSSGDRYSSQD